MFQTHTQGKEKVFCTLGWYTDDIDVVTVGHTGNKDLDLHDLACLSIDVRQLVACKVYHQLLTRLVGLGQHCGDILLGHEILLQVVIEL